MISPEEMIEAARKLFADGDVARCLRLCAALTSHADFGAEASLLQGRALLAQEGHAAEALAAFRAVSDDTPFGPDARGGEAEALLRMGQIDAAEAVLTETSDPAMAGVVAALRQDGGAEAREADALLLGQTLNALREFDRAESVLAAALAERPDDPALWLARTRTLGGLGRIDDILEACRRIRDACVNRSIGSRRAYLSEIIMLCRSLDQVRPDHPLTLALMGGVYVEQSATEQDGRNLINRANQLDPAHADQYLGAGIAELRGGGLAKARANFERAAHGMEGFAEPAAMASALGRALEGAATPEALGVADALSAQLLIAEGLGAAHRYADALDLSAAAAAAAPGTVEVRHNFAAFLSLVGRTGEAYEESLEARRLAPDDPTTNLGLASNLMAMGRLGEAWDLFEYRLAGWRKDSVAREFPVPQWEGQPLEGASLLVWREEGVGDELRGVSALPDLIDRKPSRLVVECDPRWRPIFERSFPGARFVDENLGENDFEGIDFHMPVMSLWKWFRRRVEDFPRNAYLKADPAKVAHWRGRLDDLGDGPKIGIGWKSLNPSWRKTPLLTALSDWDEITGREDLVMINLQCEGHEEELAAAEARLGRRIHVLEDANLKNDLDTTVAIMTALDAVIGARCWVPTTAGAAGTKAFTVSPKPNPFMADQNFDPWTEDGDVFYRAFEENWTGVVNQVNMALDRHLGGRQQGLSS